MKQTPPECPSVFTPNFGRKLVKYLGGDPTLIKDHWCWEEFAKAYPKLRRKAEHYFERATTGNPANAALCMARHCKSKRTWAKKVIESAKTCDPTYPAYFMVRYFGSSRKWAEKVIENSGIGDPFDVAHMMVGDCGSSEEWYEKVKTNRKKK